MSYLRALSITTDPLLFQKIPCHLVALFKDKAALKSLSSLGWCYCVYPSLSRDQFVCIIIHLIPLYLLLELKKKVILNQAKPFAAFTLFFATSVQCWHTYHKSYITCIDPHFLWIQSIISIIYYPWLYWKFVLDNNFYTCKWFLWRSCSHTVNSVPVKR